jgi:hypothetical protein
MEINHPTTMNAKAIGTVIVAAILFIGCSKKAVSTPGSTVAASTTNSEVVTKFLATDWSARPLFPSGSVLNLSEGQFRSLATATEQTNSNPVMISELEMSQLADLKKSAMAVIEAGNKAEASGDVAQAREYFMSVKQCGEALDNTNCLDLVRLVGRAFEKKAGAELAKIGS